MPYAVSTPSYRIEFVPGEVTTGTPTSGFEACGSGTAFPLKVTRDQLAKIAYRVKDARLSGSSETTYTFGSYKMEVVGTTMPTDFYSGSDTDVLVKRAYADTADPPQNHTKEPKIWTGPLSKPTDSIPTGSLCAGYSTVGANDEIQTGFTHYLESFDPPSTEDYDISGYVIGAESIRFPAGALLIFGNRIAWVDVNASGNPFDPLNELYMEVFFECNSLESIVDTYASTNLAYGDNMALSGSLTFNLSGGDSVECDLYGAYFEEVYSTIANFEMTPVEYWEYGKDSPAVAVWDDGTGALL